MWSKKATQAFNHLKKALTQAPMLSFPSSILQFVVETDAYDIGIGAVLIQEGHLLAYLSKRLSPRHQILFVYDKELLALFLTVNKWSQYLLGR